MEESDAFVVFNNSGRSSAMCSGVLMDHKCFEKGFPADINVMRARLGGHKMVTCIFLIKSRSPQHVQFGVFGSDCGFGCLINPYQPGTISYQIRNRPTCKRGCQAAREVLEAWNRRCIPQDVSQNFLEGSNTRLFLDKQRLLLLIGRNNSQILICGFCTV